MSVVPFNDNIQLNAPKHIDTRFGPFASVAAANLAINPAYRFLGLTTIVMIAGVPTDHHYRDGILDGNLVVKSTGGGGYTPPGDTTKILNGAGAEITPNKALVGLSAVDNTADIDKPVSTAVATAIAAVSAGGTDSGLSTGLSQPATTAALQALFDNASINVVYLAKQANSVYDLGAGVVNANGKVLVIQPGNTLAGAFTLNNVILYIPSIKQKCWDATATVNAIGTSTGKISVMNYGAVDDGATDSADAIQKCITDAVNNKKISTVQIPGSFLISRGIEVLRLNGGGTDYENVSITIEGDENAYDITRGQGSQILLTSKTDFAFGFMLPKGCTIRNLDIYGQNTGLRGFTIVDIANPATVWETNGTAEKTQAPHCAIAIDCYGSAAVAAGGFGYVGRDAKYIHGGGSGGTDVVMDKLGIKDFNCGIAVSPAGTTQNGEGIVAKRIFFSGVTDCFAVGNSQTRTCILRDSYAWIGIKHVLNGTYGQGISALPQIQGFINIAGGVKWLFKASNNRQDVYLENVYAELLYGLGGNFFGINSNVFFKNCFIDLMGSIPVGGQTAKQPFTILRCSSVSFIGGSLRHYGVPSYPLRISTLNNLPAVFVGTQLDRTLISDASYKGCVIPNNAGILADDNSDMRYLRVDNPNSVPIFSVQKRNRVVLFDNAVEREIDTFAPVVAEGVNVTLTFDVTTNTVSFLVPTANLKRFKVGSKITFSDNTVNDDFGAVGFSAVAMGNIASLTPTGGGSTAVVNGIPNGIISGNNYTIYAQEDTVARATHLGTLHGFSNQITGVIKEGTNPAIMLSVGDTIRHKSLPIGTYITSIVGDVISLSDTSQSATNDLICFSTYAYKQTAYNPNNTNISGIPTAFKPGDEIVNNGTTDKTILKWVCIADGITGTAFLPTFNVVETAPRISSHIAGGSYTLKPEDNGTTLLYSGAGLSTIQVPTGLPVGFKVTVVGGHLTGAITFNPVGTTINNRNGFTATAGADSIATIVSVATDVFTTSGDMA